MFCRCGEHTSCQAATFLIYEQSLRPNKWHLLHPRILPALRGHKRRVRERHHSGDTFCMVNNLL